MSGYGTAALVEEQEEQGHLNPLGGEKACVARAVALEESMALEFAQIVAKLVEAVCIGGEVEGGQDGLVDFACRPTADMSAGVQTFPRLIRSVWGSKMA